MLNQDLQVPKRNHNKILLFLTGDINWVGFIKHICCCKLAADAEASTLHGSSVTCRANLLENLSI